MLLTNTIAAPTSIAAGAGTPVGSLNGLTVSLEGTFTATYQLQISLDPSATPAASSWINEGTALTASGTLQVTKQCEWARWNCTAYTSGAPASRLAGAAA